MTKNIRQHNREASKVTAVVLNTGEAGHEASMVTAVVLNTGEAGGCEALMVTAVALHTIEAVRSRSIVCDDMLCTPPQSTRSDHPAHELLVQI